MAYNKKGAWILRDVYGKQMTQYTLYPRYSQDDGTVWPITTYDQLALNYKNYGWWAGGNPGTNTIDRLPYATDTVTTSTRGTLTGSRFYHSGISNKSYSYQAGYGGGGSSADRINYFNDMAATLLRGSGALIPFRGGAAGNLNYGWFGGGNAATEAASSEVYRLDYGNDTAARSLRGNLSRTMFFTTATGTTDSGWWGGGYVTPSILSTTTRVTYASDTATSVAKGNLSLARYIPFAIANSTYGWWGGGAGGSPIVRTTIIDRLTWATDTATASARGNLDIPRSHHSGTTDQSTYGWWGGGYKQSPLVVFSNISRMDFSNDTATSLSRGLLSRSFYSAATGNHVNFG